jgi:hypothetical protein
VSNTYFTDRDLGKKFPQILVDAGLVVERHVTSFRPMVPTNNGWSTAERTAGLPSRITSEFATRRTNLPPSFAIASRCWS